jgi:CRP-like cAMP-binding protein
MTHPSLVHGSTPDRRGADASDASTDHALALLLADETEAALRWGAAALEDDQSTPGGLIVTSLLLEKMGRTRVAIEGLESAVEQAVVLGNLPLAVAAIDDLRTLGVNVTAHLDRVSSAFCRGSQRLRGAAQPLSEMPGLKPLSPFLTGPALASRAAEIVKGVARRVEQSAAPELAEVPPLPLFSELSREALRDLLGAFEMIAVPAGHRVVREGEVASAAYLVARGELEVSRQITEGENAVPLVLTRLGAGAFFGEMALLSRQPSAASVVAVRPSILLVARRDAVEAIVSSHPEAAAGLAAHCRRLAVSNLGWASPVLAAVPPTSRAALVERCDVRVFGKGEKLFHEGEEVPGLHLLISGEVGVIARDGVERVVLATLTPGETVGEVELVLCRRAVSDAIATRPTATLFLPSDAFFTLMQEHPDVLQALYAVAVRRHWESQSALESGYTAVVDDFAVGRMSGAALLEQPPIAGPVDPPIVPARIVPVEADRPAPHPPAPQSAPKPPTTTMRMHLAAPQPPALSIGPQSAGTAPAVSTRPTSTIAPTTSSMAPTVLRPRRAAFRAFAGGAFAAAAGVAIALVAMQKTMGGSPGATVGPPVTTEALPAPIDSAVPATDPGPAPSASTSAMSSAPRVSRASQAPAPPQWTRVPATRGPQAPTGSVAATKATTASSPAVSSTSAPPPAAAAAPAEPKPANRQPVTDEFGGRQ